MIWCVLNLEHQTKSAMVSNETTLCSVEGMLQRSTSWALGTTSTRQANSGEKQKKLTNCSRVSAASSWDMLLDRILTKRVV